MDFRSRLINTFSGYSSRTYEKLLSGAVDVYLEDSRMRAGSFRIGATAEMDPYEHYLQQGLEWRGWDWKSYWLSVFATFKYDSFNDGYFPPGASAFPWMGVSSSRAIPSISMTGFIMMRV